MFITYSIFLQKKKRSLNLSVYEGVREGMELKEGKVYGNMYKLVGGDIIVVKRMVLRFLFKKNFFFLNNQFLK